MNLIVKCYQKMYLKVSVNYPAFAVRHVKECHSCLKIMLLSILCISGL